MTGAPDVTDPSKIEWRATEALSDLMDRARGIPTFAEIVMVDGRIVLEHNADQSLCSCSTFKVAAATAVMALVQQSVIALDQPITQIDSSLVFPAAAAAQQITLRHLSSHTSGLDDTDSSEPQPRERLQQLHVVAQPGRAFRYSNVAFDVAGLAAAHATGLEYEEFLRTQVLGPLGMNQTHWMSGLPLGTPFTTARDLMRLASEQLGGGRILDSGTLAEMHRVHADTFTAAPARYYGLGIDIEQWNDRTLLSHGGGVRQYGSAFVFDPIERAAVAFLFDDPAGYSISAYALLDHILDRRTLPQSRKPNSTDWSPYLGCYDNGAELLSSSGRLVLRWKSKEHLLVAADERLFASDQGVSVGLLPGAPTMISVNDFILIGARPGVLVDTKMGG